MTKSQFTEILARWLFEFLNKNYSIEYEIEVIIPDGNLSKNPNQTIKKMDAYASFEFHPDILGLLTSKTNGKVESVLLNRSISAISLKEIGEMNCYSKILHSKHSFLASLKGLPDEVNLILLNNDVSDKVLKISERNTIHIFKWDEKKSEIDQITLFPIDGNILR